MCDTAKLHHKNILGDGKLHQRLAAGIGTAAESLVVRRCGAMPTVLENSVGRLLATPGVRVVRDGAAVCVILGEPRLTTTSSTGPSPDPESVETWQSVLLGPIDELDDRLTGHFALVYLDHESRRLMMVTDRFGSYSLYYREVGNGLGIASRANLLFDDSPSISSQALFDYLYFHCIPGPATVHEGVQKLEPSQILRWEDGFPNG